MKALERVLYPNFPLLAEELRETIMALETGSSHSNDRIYAMQEVLEAAGFDLSSEELSLEPISSNTRGKLSSRPTTPRSRSVSDRQTPRTQGMREKTVPRQEKVLAMDMKCSIAALNDELSRQDRTLLSKSPDEAGRKVTP